MNLAVSSTTVGTLKRPHSNFYIVAGLGLVLAAVAATAAWQLNLAGTGSTTPAARTSVTYVAPRAVERGLTFYLVSSEAQAQLIDQAAREVALIQATDLDRPADDIYVIVVNDEQSQRNATTVINDTNAIRAQAGLSDPKVFDLRAPAP